MMAGIPDMMKLKLQIGGRLVCLLRKTGETGVQVGQHRVAPRHSQAQSVEQVGACIHAVFVLV